jgi:hypothetical protein
MKLEELSKILNPKEVYKKFKENGYDEYTNIYVSTRKDKKYMIIEPYTNKMIHSAQLWPIILLPKTIKEDQFF